jgi:hypothetical protein
MKKVLIFCNTPTILWIGFLGAKKLSKKQSKKINPFSSRLGTPELGAIDHLSLVPRNGS